MAIIPKRDIIAAAINKGGATKESLMEIADVNAKGLASQFSYLRLTGVCPVMDPETKTYKILSAEDWNAYKEEHKGKPAKPSNPKETYLRAQKAVTAASGAIDRTKKAHEADKDNELKKLQYDAAEINFKIAGIKERNAQTAYNEAVANGWKEPVEEPTEDSDAAAGTAEAVKETTSKVKKGKPGSFE